MGILSVLHPFDLETGRRDDDVGYCLFPAPLVFFEVLTSYSSEVATTWRQCQKTL